MYRNRRLVALVPIKEHSERVPGKNFKEFCGRPLFHHILETLGRLDDLDQMVVDTDSDRIHVEVPGFDRRFTTLSRPAKLCGGNVSVNRLIAHDLEQVAGDIFVQTHATNPLLKASTLHAAILRFLEVEEEGYDSLFAVNRFQTRLYDAKMRPINHDPEVLLPTQDLPPVYEENSLFYIFPRYSFARVGRRIGRAPYLFETPPMESIDIDDTFQFTLAELLANAGRE